MTRSNLVVPIMFACRRLVLALLLALPLVAHCALLLNPYAQSPTRVPFLRIDEPTASGAAAVPDDAEITFNVAPIPSPFGQPR